MFHTREATLRLAQAALTECLRVFEPLRPIADSQNVNFILRDYWQTLLTPNLRRQLEENLDTFFDLPLGYDGRRNKCPELAADHNASDCLFCLLISFHAASLFSPTNQLLILQNDFLLQLRQHESDQGRIKKPVLKQTWERAKGKTPRAALKKEHEVSVMAEFCATLASTGSTVVDVGSGKGYLGTQLALHHDLDVLGLEASSSNSSGAMKRHEHVLSYSCKECKKLVRSLRTHQHLVAHAPHLAGAPPETLLCPVHAAGRKFVTAAVMVSPDTPVGDLVRSVLWQSSGDGDLDSEELLLTGLHTCGDLASTAVRLFTSSPQLRRCCVVSCCYNLITEPVGFPLSEFLRSRGFRLSYNIRQLAAQSPHRAAVSRLYPPASLFYRTLLQKILSDQLGYVERDWSVGVVSADSFYDYSQKALARLKLPVSIDQDLAEQMEAKYEAERRTGAALFLFRMTLGCLIESIIHLDRLLALLESPAVSHASLIQLFDPVASPRCVALVALKEPL